MAQAVSQSMWDLWWTKWHWDKFFPLSTSIFPSQFYSTGVPLHGKQKKPNHLHYTVAQ
jgi:hypothetical protein